MSTASNGDLRTHSNWNLTDYHYLREKGYADAEIRAIWDRDRKLGQGPQEHLNNPFFRVID